MSAAVNARPGETGIESALSIPVWALVLKGLRYHLRQRAKRHDLLAVPDAAGAESLSGAIQTLCAETSSADALWPLIRIVHLAKAQLHITLDAQRLAQTLGLAAEDLNTASTAFESPFNLRRRGVETRLVSGSPEPRPDPVLQQNLARAHRWAKWIRHGESLTSIARSEACSESSLRSRLTLAFLAPPTRWNGYRFFGLRERKRGND